MSGWRSHKWVTKLIFGDPHREVHSWIDWPFCFLGRRHRKLFHDPITAPLVGGLAAAAHGKDPVSGALAGLGHAVQDHSTSAVRRATPRPLRFLLPIAARTAMACAVPSLRRRRAAGSSQEPDAATTKDANTLTSEPLSTWWATDAGYWTAAIGPGAASLFLAGYFALYVFLHGFFGGYVVDWERLAFHIAIALAPVGAAYPFFIRWLTRWWREQRPWRPLRTKDGLLETQVFSDQVYVKATRGDGRTTWRPEDGFLRGDEEAAPPLPEWLVPLSVLLFLPAVVLGIAAFVLVVMAAFAPDSMLKSTGRKLRLR